MSRAKAAILGILVRLFALSPGRAQEGRLAGEVGFDILEAIDKAIAAAGGGEVFQAELEPEGGKLVYSIDIDLGAESVNVVLDAKSGKVIEKSDEDQDLSKILAAAKIDLKTAIRKARTLRKGRIVEAQLGLLEPGRPGIAVKVLHEGKIGRVIFDAVTGEEVGKSGAGSSGGKSSDPEGARYTTRFTVEKSELGPTGRSPWFILEPGYFLVLEGMEGEKKIRLVVTVLDETKVVDGATTRVVEERESENGALVEISRNFMAISSRTTDVYYFGETVDMYKDGEVVSHEGEWLSGEDGAVFGLMMPANPLLGARYHQETAPGAAMDRAEIESLTATVETPAGKFEGCLRVLETTPLEPGAKERKWHKRGIGLIRDADLRLVRYGKK